jgi:hypothetical protein
VAAANQHRSEPKARTRLADPTNDGIHCESSAIRIFLRAGNDQRGPPPEKFKPGRKVSQCNSVVLK